MFTLRQIHSFVKQACIVKIQPDFQRYQQADLSQELRHRHIKASPDLDINALTNAMNDG